MRWITWSIVVCLLGCNPIQEKQQEDMLRAEIAASRAESQSLLAQLNETKVRIKLEQRAKVFEKQGEMLKLQSEQINLLQRTIQELLSKDIEPEPESPEARGTRPK